MSCRTAKNTASQAGLFTRRVLLPDGLAQGWDVPESTKGVVVDLPENCASEGMVHNLFAPNVIRVVGGAP